MHAHQSFITLLCTIILCKWQKGKITLYLNLLVEYNLSKRHHWNLSEVSIQKVMDNLTCCHFVFCCFCGHLPGDLVSAPCVFRSDCSPCPLPCLSCLNPHTAILHPPSEEVICSWIPPLVSLDFSVPVHCQLSPVNIFDLKCFPASWDATASQLNIKRNNEALCLNYFSDRYWWRMLIQTQYC